MTRFARIRRRPDEWTSPHERARARAAERLDGPLGLAESNWLDEHLAGCLACAAVAASYDADRLALRALRDAPPEPPRDLWARTAAAIEQESGRVGHPRPAASPRRRVPVGLLSGVAVVAVVVAASAVSGGIFNGTEPSTAVAVLASDGPVATAGAPSAAPTSVIADVEPTPFDVGAGDVQWFGKEPDGQLAYNTVPIRKVCPADNVDSCATVDDSGAEHMALIASPKSIIGSPTQQQAVVVSDDGSGGQQVTVLSLPAVEPSPTPSPTPTPTATAPATAPPPSTPIPTAAATSSTTASVAPTTGPETAEPTASPPTASAEATAPASPSATPEPSPSATPEPTATPGPVLTPEPTMATSLAIASNISVVGQSAAFSADGEWFAFTARPTDASSGPDVYVWHVGDKTARRLTKDGKTYFASWDGDTIIASRPDLTSTDAAAAKSLMIDPRTGDEQAAGDMWRPVVDPSSKRAVGWAGAVTPSATGLAVIPADGRLELRAWSSDEGAFSGSGASQVVVDGPVRDFDVRWDESGIWFAVWVADASGTDVGRLSLYRVDPKTGLLQHPDGAPADVAALPGFSIGEGRLAWATPPGQGGEGSRVQIVAWAPDGVGTVETAPGEDLIVVR